MGWLCRLEGWRWKRSRKVLLYYVVWGAVAAAPRFMHKRHLPQETARYACVSVGSRVCVRARGRWLTSSSRVLVFVGSASLPACPPQCGIHPETSGVGAQGSEFRCRVIRPRGAIRHLSRLSGRGVEGSSHLVSGGFGRLTCAWTLWCHYY